MVFLETIYLKIKFSLEGNERKRADSVEEAFMMQFLLC